jgi:cytoskeletal protein CcmA (bactofilin family)
MTFMFERNAKNPIDTLIGASTRIEGDLLFCGGLRIDGHVRGNVTGEAGDPTYVVLGEAGRIDGEVRCSSLSSAARSTAPCTCPKCLKSSRKPAL